MAGQPKRRAMAEALEKRTAQYFEEDPINIAIGLEPKHSTLDYVCAWIADGDGNTMTRLAQELNASRTWLTEYLDKTFGDAECDRRLSEARARASHTCAEAALTISDEKAETSVDVARAGNRVRARQWVAERWNRTQYGGQQGTHVSISIGSLHLDALRAVRQEVPIVTVGAEQVQIAPTSSAE